MKAINYSLELVWNVLINFFRRRYQACLSSPPYYGTCLAFFVYLEKDSVLSARVDSRRIAPPANLRAQVSRVRHSLIFNVLGRRSYYAVLHARHILEHMYQDMYI